MAPAELEGHLLSHPDVADTCVVGVPDDYSGEVPFAFVVLKENTALHLERTPSDIEKVRASILKASSGHGLLFSGGLNRNSCSMSLTPKSRTRG